MQWLLSPIAVFAGMLMVVQSACNGMLEKMIDRPVTVACYQAIDNRLFAKHGFRKRVFCYLTKIRKVLERCKLTNQCYDV